MDEILKPLSLVAWLLLRIFVLSIGQVFYWGALVLIFILFIFRLIPNGQVESEPVDNNTQNEMLKNYRTLALPVYSQ
jgi:Ca2+/Na+ antiporter